MRRALGPGKVVLMFGPATWVRVLVVMMFLLRERLAAPVWGRSFCLPATTTWLDWGRRGRPTERRKLASRRRRGWDGPYRGPVLTRSHAHLCRTSDWRRQQRRSAGLSGWSSDTPSLIIAAFQAWRNPQKSACQGSTDLARWIGQEPSQAELPAAVFAFWRLRWAVQTSGVNARVHGASEGLELHGADGLAREIREPLAPPGFLDPANIHEEPQACAVLRPLGPLRVANDRTCRSSSHTGACASCRSPSSSPLPSSH